MSETKILLKGTLILTLTGFLSRIIGFFYRIFLSHTIGAQGMGIYQMVFPVYGLCLALSTAGIQTVLSQKIAARISQKKRDNAFYILICGLLLSLLLSVSCCLLLYRNAAFLAASVLKEHRCESLLKLLAYAVPFASVHACITSYYYAMRATKIPAFSQLLEQGVRIFASWIIFRITLQNGGSLTPLLAASGILAGECASALFSFIMIQFEFSKYRYHPKNLHPAAAARELLTDSFPLTVNRVLISILTSVEAFLIPLRLKVSGMDTAAALSTYGVLIGMALPLILFPSAITTSVSAMLLPSVAAAQASKNIERISRTIEMTVKYCMILGLFAFGFFFCYGTDLGNAIFKNTDAGTYIGILSFICPFLYLNGTLSGILHGLGKTYLSFWQNAAGLAVRILFIYAAIPMLGIRGYLFGLLASQLVSCALCLYFLSRTVSFTFCADKWIVVPLLSLFAANRIGNFFFPLLSGFTRFPRIIPLGILAALQAALYLGFLLGLGILHLPKSLQFTVDKK